MLLGMYICLLFNLLKQNNIMQKTIKTYVTIDIKCNKAVIHYFNAPNLMTAKKFYSNAISLNKWQKVIKNTFNLK